MAGRQTAYNEEQDLKNGKDNSKIPYEPLKKSEVSVHSNNSNTPICEAKSNSRCPCSSGHAGNWDEGVDGRPVNTPAVLGCERFGTYRRTH